MAPRRARISEELVEAFGSEMMRFNRRRGDSPEGTRVELSAFRILWLLADRGPLTMREIGEALHLEQSTVSRQVTAAERQGLLERAAESGTSRRVVSPTAQGEADYAHDLDLRSEAIRQALATLGDERVQDLVRGLRDFSDAFERAVERPGSA